MGERTATAVAVYRRAAGELAERAAAGVERLQAEAASAFGVPLPAFVPLDLDLGVARVSFAYPQLTLLTEQLASAGWRLLGAKAARARAIAKAREQAGDEAGMVLGRLPGSDLWAAGRVGPPARRAPAPSPGRPGRWPDRRHRARRWTLAEAEDRRNQRAGELDRAAELLPSVAAWIRPAPLPPEIGGAGAAERVQ